MNRVLITLAIVIIIAGCTTVTTCGSDRLFTKGEEYCSDDIFFWFENPKPAFDKFNGHKPTDCELEELLNLVRLHNDQPEVISEECK